MKKPLFLSLLALLAFASIADASHPWGYHWGRTANPFTLKLGDNVSSTWDAHLLTASDDWSLSLVLDTTVVAGSNTLNPKRCRPKSGRIEVCSALYGANGWLGLAQIWVSGGHITQGTTKLNDTYFNVPPYNTSAWRQLVMCQEPGHNFGLNHQDEGFANANLGTCMDYTNNPAGPPSNEHPNAHDFEQLETDYAHLDTVQTAQMPAPPAMNQIDFSRRAQWGKRISSRHQGKREVYELDFGHGHKVFTFVTWAE